ncbi:HalX domain-containing protein [Haloarcula brevis]|uniref:HalX domain-containing protein n=1 Tax=Haloarcula brevis TaxID=3111453 RepID=UPI00300F4BB7
MTTEQDPVVLVVDDDEKLLETYEMWLAADYDLRTAASGEEALEKLDEAVQVVLLDRLMPGLSGDEVLDRIRASGVECQVAMVTAVEPDFDIVDMPFDAYVPKALDRETVRETVDRLVARARYDGTLQEHYAVAEKLSTIESRKSDAEMAENQDYQELLERFDELDERLSTRASNLDREDIVSGIGDVPDVDVSGTDERDSQGDSA